LLDSAVNGIYHNNFVTNTVQASDNLGNNRWDLGLMAGGNYWSNHECIGNPSDGQSRSIGDVAVDAYPYQDRDGWHQPKHT
jgi:nitrous oxidase accessory protein NosD